MIIKILGSGCPNCQKLEANTQQAVKELNLADIKVEHIYDIDKIIEMGIVLTPAIVFDNKIKAMGRIAGVEEIKTWLTNQK